MDGIAKWLEVIGILVGVVGFIVGTIWTTIKFGLRVHRAFHASDSFHNLFGDDPVSELHRIVSEATTSIGELSIRQRIAEHHLQIGVFVCDTNGRTTWANDYMCEAFGIDSNSMDGYGWLSAVSKKDRQRVYEEWQRCVQNDLPYKDTYLVEPVNGGESWKCLTEAWPKRVGDHNLYFVGYTKRLEE